MLGQNNPNTIRTKVKIKKHDIAIFIDYDSTHNFSQERMIKFLGLSMSISSQFQVMVRNGE